MNSIKDARILFVRLRSLGDTVLMTPALEVAKRIPGNKVAVVCEEPCDQVLIGNPFVDHVFVTSRKHKLASRVRVIRSVRAYRPDLVIDLHGGTTSSLITGLSGARQRVGPNRCRNAWLYNLRLAPAKNIWERDDLHTVEEQLAALRFLGFPVEPIPALRAPESPADIQLVASALLEQGLQDGFVLIHPAAAFDTKQWEVARFAELVRRLISEGQRVAATVGPGEEDVLEELSRAVGEDLAVFSPMPLSRFAALASHCGLYVGNDTGTTHLAAALGKPILVVFGSSDSRVWYPWGTKFHLIKSNLACIPCPGYQCLEYPEPRCIRSIEVDEVYQAARELIAERLGRMDGV